MCVSRTPFNHSPTATVTFLLSHHYCKQWVYYPALQGGSPDGHCVCVCVCVCVCMCVCVCVCVCVCELHSTPLSDHTSTVGSAVPRRIHGLIRGEVEPPCGLLYPDVREAHRLASPAAERGLSLATLKTDHAHEHRLGPGTGFAAAPKERPEVHRWVASHTVCEDEVARLRQSDAHVLARLRPGLSEVDWDTALREDLAGPCQVQETDRLWGGGGGTVHPAATSGGVARAAGAPHRHATTHMKAKWVTHWWVGSNEKATLP